MAYAACGTFAADPYHVELTGEDGATFTLTPPGQVAEVPPQGLLRDAKGFLAPLDDRKQVQVQVAADSERLALLSPFPAWDGGDLAGLRLLVKARGKCTTDHISPAGPWLRFRGHLDNISGNMLSGAINAFTGEAGTGRNQESGATGKLSDIAREYQAAGIGWVIVGDSNYGEGSSREHAAMSPRQLGARAVITRSFARIHETNLKKQGMLPLTFIDPADYDKVREDDRIDLVGVAQLAPESTVTAVLHHQDGSTTEIPLRHSLNAEQIGWFKAGSALNALR